MVEVHIAANLTVHPLPLSHITSLTPQMLRPMYYRLTLANTVLIQTDPLLATIAVLALCIARRVLPCYCLRLLTVNHLETYLSQDLCLYD